MIRFYGIFVVLAVVPNEALADSGPVQAWFAKDAASVSAALANLCADRNAAVVEQDNNHVLCSKVVTGFKGVLAQALIGNSYSTTPEIHVRFSIFQNGPLLRVQASQWLETQMAYGQIRREQLTGKKQNAEMLSYLIAIGGQTSPPAASTTEPAAPAAAAPPKALP